MRDTVEQAERELGRLDLAAVVASDEGTGLALDALRAALAGRAVAILTPDTALDDALRSVSERL